MYFRSSSASNISISSGSSAHTRGGCYILIYGVAFYYYFINNNNTYSIYRMVWRHHYFISSLSLPPPPPFFFFFFFFFFLFFLFFLPSSSVDVVVRITPSHIGNLFQELAPNPLVYFQKTRGTPGFSRYTKVTSRISNRRFWACTYFDLGNGRPFGEVVVT